MSIFLLKKNKTRRDCSNDDDTKRNEQLARYWRIPGNLQERTQEVHICTFRNLWKTWDRDNTGPLDTVWFHISYIYGRKGVYIRNFKVIASFFSFTACRCLEWKLECEDAALKQVILEDTKRCREVIKEKNPGAFVLRCVACSIKILFK